jgi:hypothetical protein
MLTSEQISAYFENGYLLVEDVVTPEQLQRMQEITHEFIDRSRHVTASNDVYDLDEGHNSETPKLTRIKLPHKQHPFFWDVVKNSGITEVLRALIRAPFWITIAPKVFFVVQWTQPTQTSILIKLSR